MFAGITCAFVVSLLTPLGKLGGFLAGAVLYNLGAVLMVYVDPDPEAAFAWPLIPVFFFVAVLPMVAMVWIADGLRSYFSPPRPISALPKIDKPLAEILDSK
jgi:hypothetical protein